MKKTFIPVIGAMLLFAACNENKEPVEQKPVETAVAAKAAPAPAPQAEQESVSFKTIDWAQAKEMVKAGGIYVDVRTQAELADGFAPYATNLPLNEMRTRFAELPKDKDLLIYCRSGRRSEAAAHFLVKQGYTRVYNIAGGFLAYPRDAK